MAENSEHIQILSSSTPTLLLLIDTRADFKRIHHSIFKLIDIKKLYKMD